MGIVRTFLETSTIHGLGHISSNKKAIVKLLWILVVVAGFTGAGIIIYQSFKSWDESPRQNFCKLGPGRSKLGQTEYIRS